MTLGYEFRQASDTLQNLAPADQTVLDWLCGRIQQAEGELRVAAADALEYCHTACQGICCRNVELRAVLGYSDFVYILNRMPQLVDRMAACLENESAFFPADCIFLEHGNGPCIFPGTAMPMICITTFCSEHSPAQKEIRRLKWQFFHLNWFLRSLKSRIFLRSLLRRLKKNSR